MRGSAGFHADQAGRQLLEEFAHFRSSELLANDDLAGGVDAVNAEKRALRYQDQWS